MLATPPSAEVPAPSDPVGPIVPETPTVPADPVPAPEQPSVPEGPDAPEPVEPAPPLPDGLALPAGEAAPPAGAPAACACAPVQAAARAIPDRAAIVMTLLLTVALLEAPPSARELNVAVGRPFRASLSRSKAGP